MANISGNVSIVQLSDLEMAKIFEEKAANVGKFTVQLPVPSGQGFASTTQANIHWSGLDGLEAVHMALKKILHVAETPNQG